MLQGGGRVLEDIRELKEEAGLMKLIDQTILPSSDVLGDWLRRMGEGEGLRGLDTVRNTILLSPRIAARVYVGIWDKAFFLLSRENMISCDP